MTVTVTFPSKRNGDEEAMHKSTFVIEDQFGPYPGYTTGERWNGWATPYFECEVALRMVDDWKADEWGDAHYV
jgi:hypothetical protein